MRLGVGWGRVGVSCCHFVRAYRAVPATRTLDMAIPVGPEGFLDHRLFSELQDKTTTWACAADALGCSTLIRITTARS